MMNKDLVLPFFKIALAFSVIHLGYLLFRL